MWARWKSWIYIPLFAALDAGVWTARIPMLAAGAVSIWLFYLFMQGFAGERAAVAGCLFAGDGIPYICSQPAALIGGLLPCSICLPPGDWFLF